jgi:hypothetical protein
MENLMDGALSSKDYHTEELAALKLEHKVCDLEVQASFWKSLQNILRSFSARKSFMDGYVSSLYSLSKDSLNGF